MRLNHKINVKLLYKYQFLTKASIIHIFNAFIYYIYSSLKKVSFMTIFIIIFGTLTCLAVTRMCENDFYDIQ